MAACAKRYHRTQMLGWSPCNNAAELEAFEAATVALGHEGVILRDPNGPYKFGRSYPTDGKLLKSRTLSAAPNAVRERRARRAREPSEGSSCAP